MEAIAFDKGITIDEHIAENIWIQADHTYLHRVVTSLIENALIRCILNA